MGHCCLDGWCEECENYNMPEAERDVYLQTPPRTTKRYIMLFPCSASEGCSNEARYDSGYCGLHDIELNGGKGKRLSDAQQLPASED